MDQLLDFIETDKEEASGETQLRYLKMLCAHTQPSQFHYFIRLGPGYPLDIGAA
jgi:hypothetical protein